MGDALAAAQGACMNIVPPGDDYAFQIRIDGEDDRTINCCLPLGDLKQVYLRVEKPHFVYAGNARITPLTSTGFRLGAGLAFVRNHPIIKLADGRATLVLIPHGRQAGSSLRKDLKILDLFNLGPHSTGCNLHPGHSAGRALITP